jgi:heptosyltransferase-2
MPDLRQAIVADLPRKRLALGEHKALAARLKREGYGSALIMPRTWKAALALPADAAPPENWPLPELKVPPAEVAGWRERLGLTDTGRPTVALAPGAVGPSKRWPGAAYAELARHLIHQGANVWVLGGPAEAPLVRIIKDGAPEVRDLTGTDLRNAILALAAANVAVSNDSGLLHVAAALGTPAIGIFGPTSPWHWAPLNPIAATIQTATQLDCQPCHKPTCRVRHHRCMRDISADQVLEVTQRVLTQARAS